MYFGHVFSTERECLHFIKACSCYIDIYLRLHGSTSVVNEPLTYSCWRFFYSVWVGAKLRIEYVVAVGLDTFKTYGCWDAVHQSRLILNNSGRSVY